VNHDEQFHFNIPCVKISCPGTPVDGRDTIVPYGNVCGYATQHLAVRRKSHWMKPYRFLPRRLKICSFEGQESSMCSTPL
jgi:hypothetical protein